MKKIQAVLFVVICFSLLSCSSKKEEPYRETEARYNSTIKSLIGLTEQELIDRWGIPTTMKRQTKDETIYKYITESTTADDDILRCNTYFTMINQTVVGAHFTGDGCVE